MDADAASSQNRLLETEGRTNSSMYDALVIAKKDEVLPENSSMLSPVTGTVIPVTDGSGLQQSGFPAADGPTGIRAVDDDADVDDAGVPHTTGPCFCCKRWKAPLILSVYSFLTGAAGMLTNSLLVKVNSDFFGGDQHAGMVTSIAASVIAAINIFLVTPYGRLIDSVGRRPFFLANAIITVAQYALLAAFPTNPIPFLIAKSVNGLIQSSYQGAFIADLIAPEHRTYAFTIMQGIGMLTMITSLPIGIMSAKTPDLVFFLAAVVCSGLGLLFAIFCIPESLARADRTKFSIRGAFENPLKGAKVLLDSRALILITVTACLVATADVGTQDIYMYYLNQRVGFTPQDNAIFFVVMSVLSVASLFLLLPILQRYLSSVSILCFSLAANATMMILVATIWARWAVFAVIAPMYAGLVLASPLLDGLITNIGREEDVGKRITAMTAVSDFCNALGPLVFSLLYGLLPAGLVALPFFVSFGLISCGCLLIWCFLAKAIRHDQDKLERELAEEGAARLLNDEESATVRAEDDARTARNERAAAAVRSVYDADDVR
jgi:DHA1 family tetracycline resistance protein-like MFS transporter